MALADFTITDVGRALLSEAALAGDIVFTRGAVGKGVLRSHDELAKCTKLLDYVADMHLAAPQREGDTVRMRCQFSNKSGGGVLPEFRLNEAGLFARLGAAGTEVLLAYANTCDATLGDVIPDTECEFELEFVLAIAGADKLSFGSEGLIFATMNDLVGKADRPQTYTATLTAAKWTGSAPPYTQTVSIAGVPAGSVVVVGLAAGATEQQLKTCRAARIEPSGQAEGAITLKAMGTKPSIDLPISATVVK